MHLLSRGGGGGGVVVGGNGIKAKLSQIDFGLSLAKWEMEMVDILANNLAYWPEVPK